MMRRLFAALILVLISAAAHAQCGGPGNQPSTQGIAGCPLAVNFQANDVLLGMQMYNGTTITNIPGKTVRVTPTQLAGIVGGGAASSQFNATFPAGGVAAGIQQGANMAPMQGDGSGNLQVNLHGTFDNSLDAVASSATNTTTTTWLYGFNGTAWDRLRVDAFKNLQVNCTIGCVGGVASNGADAIAPAATNGLTLGFLYGFNGATWDRLRVDGSKFLEVNCIVGCSGGTFVNSADAVVTSGTNGQSAAWLYGFNGTTWDRLRVDGAKNLDVNCLVGCTGGSLSNATDTVATSSTNGGAIGYNYGFNGATWDRLRVDSSKNLLVGINSPIVAGTNTIGAVTQASGPWTINATQLGGNAIATGNGVTSSGSLRVTVASDSTGQIALATGSATVGKVDLLGNAGGVMDFAGQNAAAPASALLTGCEFVTSPTTLTTGNVSPVQCDSAGNRLVRVNVALPAGTNILGKLTTDQTTPGTTDLVHAAQQGTWTTTATQATGTNLHMVCDSGCSATSAPADEAAFTVGVTSQSPVGGLYQTTATSNPLTNGQMGVVQMTANRALMTNLRTAAGVEIGVAAAPVEVTLGNTAANTNQLGVSVGQINGVTPLMGAGVSGTGSQRVSVAQDTTTVAGSASLPAGSNNIGQVSLAQIGTATIATGVGGGANVGTQRVTVGQDRTTIAGSAPGTVRNPSSSIVSIQGVPLASPVAVTGKILATSDLSNPGTSDLTHNKPAILTIVPLDVATVTTGGVAVTALLAGHRSAGGWIQNPPTATINLCINEAGTAAGTSSAGSLTCVTAGQTYTLIPSANAVSVISSDSTHPFSGYGLN